MTETMAKTHPPENPYLAARQEWNERYGSYVKAAAAWRIVGITGMFMAVIGFSYALYQSTQVKLVPYIVEVDKLGTAATIGFPQQIAALRPTLADYLGQAFTPSRYGPAPLLRGVYMTSGTQEGRPIDRVIGNVARAFGLEGNPLGVQAGQGRSFFLTRLLEGVPLTNLWVGLSKSPVVALIVSESSPADSVIEALDSRVRPSVSRSRLIRRWHAAGDKPTSALIVSAVWRLLA